MAQMTVADLSIEEFEQLMRSIFKQVLVEALTDPDEGLELRDDMVAKLQRSVSQLREGAVTYSAGCL